MMCIKSYTLLLLFTLCSGLEFTSESVNLNYCEIQKMFCKELDHVACFDEANLRRILSTITDKTTCVKTFAQGVKKNRRQNGLANAQWNRELESFSMLTTNNDTRQCGVSVKYLDMKFITVKVEQLPSSTFFHIPDNSEVLTSPLVTDIGCACKKIKDETFVFCWHNYSKRQTSVKYENILNGAHIHKVSIYIIFISVLSAGSMT